MLTKLRITFTITCVLSCLSFTALWVRSYKTLDLLTRLDGKRWTTAIGSERGSAYIIHMYIPNWNAGYVTPRSTAWQYLANKARPGTAKFDWAFTATKKKISLPYYVLIGIAASLSLVPWMRRFSLRALLIITGLAAFYLSALRWVLK